MKTKQTRIENLKQYITSNKTIEEENFCKINNISKDTLRRYVKDLKLSGYNIKYKKGIYHLITEPKSYNRDIITNKHMKKYEILLHIYNYTNCSRKKLMQLCNISGSQIRNFDILINELLECNSITKINKNGKVYYTKAKTNSELTKISSKKLKELISYIETLQYNQILEPQITEVKFYLINLLNSRENREKTVQYMQQIRDIEFKDYYVGESLIKEVNPLLLEMCEKHRPIKITTINEEQLPIIPLKILYYKQERVWYLAYTLIKNMEKYNIIRISNIVACDKLEKCSDTNYLQQVEEILKQLIQNEKHKFGVSTDSGSIVELLFEDSYNIVEKAKKRLNRYGTFSEANDGWVYFKGYIIGTDELLAWLRRFGSSVLIIAPLRLQKLHIKTAEKIIEQYGEK